MKTYLSHGRINTAILFFIILAAIVSAAIGTYVYHKNKKVNQLSTEELPEDIDPSSPFSIASALYSCILYDNFEQIDHLIPLLKEAERINSASGSGESDESDQDYSEYDDGSDREEFSMERIDNRNTLDISKYLSNAANDNIKSKIIQLTDALNNDMVEPEAYKTYLTSLGYIFEVYQPKTEEETALRDSVNAYVVFKNNPDYTIQDIRAIFGPYDALKVCIYLIGSKDYSRISPYELRSFIIHETKALIKQIPASIPGNMYSMSSSDFVDFNANTYSDLVKLKENIALYVGNIPFIADESPDENMQAIDQFRDFYTASLNRATGFSNAAINYYQCIANSSEPFTVTGILYPEKYPDVSTVGKLQLHAYKMKLTKEISQCSGITNIFILAPDLKSYSELLSRGAKKMSDEDRNNYHRDISLLEKLNSKQNEPLTITLLGSDIAAVENHLEQNPEPGKFIGTREQGHLYNINLPSFRLLKTLELSPETKQIFGASKMLTTKRTQSQNKLKVITSFKKIEDEMKELNFQMLKYEPKKFMALALKKTSVPDKKHHNDSVTENVTESSTDNDLILANNTPDSGKSDEVVISENISTQKTDTDSGTGAEVSTDTVTGNDSGKVQPSENNNGEASGISASSETPNTAENQNTGTESQVTPETIKNTESGTSGGEEASRPEDSGTDNPPKKETGTGTDKEDGSKDDTGVIATGTTEGKEGQEETVFPGSAEDLSNNSQIAVMPGSAEETSSNESLKTAVQEQDQQIPLEELHDTDIANLKLLIEEKNTDAMFELATRYMKGHKGVKKNHAKAMELLKLACENNNANANAMNLLGNIILSNNKSSKEDQKKGAEYIISSAEAGLPDSMYMAGLILYNGDYGVPRNYHKAFEYFNMASEQDNTGATYMLAKIYMTGNGTKPNKQKAFNLLQTASRTNGDAAYDLAVILEGGVIEGIKDEQAAVENYVKAARMGNKNAYKKAGLALINLRTGTKEALKYLQTLRNLNDQEVDTALLNYYVKINNSKEIAKLIRVAPPDIQEKYPVEMGILYETGNGVEQSYEQAEKYYRIGVSRQIPNAFCYLGDLFFYARGRDRDLRAAVGQYTRGSDLGSEICSEKLAVIKVTELQYRNYDEAYIIINSIPQEKRTNISKSILAAMYLYGKGVPKDQDAALKILKTMNTRGANRISSLYEIKQQNGVICTNPVISGSVGSKNKNSIQLAVGVLGDLFFIKDYMDNSGDLSYNELLSKAKKICRTPIQSIMYDMKGNTSRPAAANPTDPAAQYQLAVSLLKEGKQEESFNWMKKAADAQYTKACNNLGIYYLLGIGTAKSSETGYEYLMKAVSRGDARANFNAAALKLHGIGTGSDRNKAIDLLTTASRLGNTNASMQLSYDYINGNSSHNVDEAFTALLDIMLDKK